MKKMLFMAAVAALFSASCSKDRTCTCTNSNSKSTTTSTTTTKLVKVTKGQAKSNCISTKETDSNGVTYTSDCKLS